MSKYRGKQVSIDWLLDYVNEVNLCPLSDPKELVGLNNLAEKAFLKTGRLKEVRRFSDGRKTFTIEEAGY